MSVLSRIVTCVGKRHSGNAIRSHFLRNLAGSPPQLLAVVWRIFSGWILAQFQKPAFQSYIVVANAKYGADSL